jgi:hypothetical protein
MTSEASCDNIKSRWQILMVDSDFGHFKCGEKRMKNVVKSFHQTLNNIDTHISFSVEHESNGQLPFLDTLTI